MTQAEQLKAIIARVQSIGASLNGNVPLKANDAAWLRASGEGIPLAKVEAVATAISVTTQAVRQAAWEGVIPQPSHGWLDTLAVMHGWTKRDRDRLRTKTTIDEQLKRTRNEILELRRDEARRNLIPSDEVRRTVMRAFIAIRTRFLVIPRRVSQPLALATDPIDIELRLDKELRDALSEIAECEWFNESDVPTAQPVAAVKPKARQTRAKVKQRRKRPPKP